MPILASANAKSAFATPKDPVLEGSQLLDGEADSHSGNIIPATTSTDEPSSDSSSEMEDSPASWKDEVAARVNHYRRRRPRTPRYPSLSLKFDAPRFETDYADMADSSEARADNAFSPGTPIILQSALVADSFTYASAHEPTGRILEFPRSPSIPLVARPDAIADPVMDLPRILDVPEVMPPPPALGGIHVEADVSPAERRPGLEIPLQAASFSRRLCAGLIDALLVILSLVGFGAIFFRMIHAVLSPREMISGAAGVGVALWLLYQHLLLGYSGSTLGLRCAKLQLRKFDGRRVSRFTRFIRNLAAALSAASLGLGYLWCFLDEDQLCWHDRITRTYMAPEDLASN